MKPLLTEVRSDKKLWRARIQWFDGDTHLIEPDSAFESRTELRSFLFILRNKLAGIEQMTKDEVHKQVQDAFDEHYCSTMNELIRRTQSFIAEHKVNRELNIVDTKQAGAL